jgi:hypothetical protein
VEVELGISLGEVDALEGLRTWGEAIGGESVVSEA